MLCEECKKNPAEVLMTTVVDGHAASRHLCRECVKKYKAGDLQAVLAAVLSNMSQREERPALVCPVCGETFDEFQKSGVLGCAGCYQACKSELTPLIARVQGRSQHAGRRPPVSPEEEERLRQAEALRAQMEAAVAVENFEEAARLRDALRAMTPAREEKQ